MDNHNDDSSQQDKCLGSFIQNVRFDAVAGLLVFLIALPLCLGIANASGFPAINGVYSAIAGGLICGFLSNSEMTIKGPAAGMIAICLGAVIDFANAAEVGRDAISSTDPAVYLRYLPMVAAVGVMAGVIQILLGLLRAGILADLFPTAVIHGLLASIGLIIIGKQLYVLLGLKPNGSTKAYEAYLELPLHLPQLAWQVALVGLISLLILFLYPALKRHYSICGLIPPQVIVLVLAIPAAYFLYQGFANGSRSYVISEDDQPVNQIVQSMMVTVPNNASEVWKSFIFPDFTVIGSVIFWKWVLMFVLVGSIESLLSAKAVDVLDPWKRQTNLNRDLVAVGTANAAVAMVGGLPMISEIVRSAANCDYGARTRWANTFHGIFLLISILLLPQVLNRIPLTALAAMLIYAGCRLAHYKHFLHVYHLGKEQLAVFMSTVLGVLATDLLIGVGVGILVKFAIQMYFGVRPTDFANMRVDVRAGPQGVIIRIAGPVVFTNWLLLRKQIHAIPADQDVVLDCSASTFLDHTVMSRLDELRREFAERGRSLALIGLDQHHAQSKNPLAARSVRKPSDR